MGQNDYTVRADGSLRRGNLGIEAMERQRELLAAEIQTLKDEALPMLNGTGFIVITPSNPRFDGVEHPTIEQAQEVADEQAYQTGRAIIYAPVAVIKPRRDTTITQPSELLQQISAKALPGKVADVPAPAAK